MLKLKKLNVDDELYKLTDINLQINPNELHVIMGPPGSKKSALVNTITGWPGINISSGDLIFEKKKLNTLDPDARSRLGVYAVLQGLFEFEHLTNLTIMQEILEAHGLSTAQIENKYKEYCKILGLSSHHGHKQANSMHLQPGEAKRNELLQMLMLEPKLAILDQIEDGLDDDEIAIAGDAIRHFLSKKNRSALIVTNNHALLDLLTPTHIHIMVDGAIKMTGDNTLYKRIIEDGYSEFS